MGQCLRALIHSRVKNRTARILEAQHEIADRPPLYQQRAVNQKIQSNANADALIY